MTDRAYGVKQSDFTQQTSIVSGSYIGFFANGYNYKISYDNFLAGLGVTGTIVQDGAVTGTPVLDKQGNVNNIRNIENGSGIVANVSAENGIELSHNFTVDATGEPIMQNITADSPTLVSIVGGTGIRVQTVGETVSVSSTEAESYASVYMQGNSTATTIAVAGTPVKMAGTFSLGDTANFTVDATGRMTYTGETAGHIVNLIATLDVSTGSNLLVSMYIAKNGTVISTKMTDTISSAQPRAIATFINTTLEPNDYIEAFVSNDSTTASVIAKNVRMGAL